MQNFVQGEDESRSPSNRRGVVPHPAAVAPGTDCVSHFAAFMYPRQQQRCQAGVTSNSNWEAAGGKGSSRGRDFHPQLCFCVQVTRREKSPGTERGTWRRAQTICHSPASTVAERKSTAPPPPPPPAPPCYSTTQDHPRKGEPAWKNLDGSPDLCDNGTNT